MAGAVARAGSATKFWEKRAAMQRELRAEQQRLGLNGSQNQKALYSQFPTPEITLCKPVVIAPGASAPVSLTGKFMEKTVFLAANDDVTLEGTMAAGKFTGTATAAADAGPGWAPVHAIAPVSGANRSCGAIFVGPVAAYEFKGDNGWTIKLTPQAKAFALSGEDATLPYAVTFFKDGEAKPFKTMAGSHHVAPERQSDARHVHVAERVRRGRFTGSGACRDSAEVEPARRLQEARHDGNQPPVGPDGEADGRADEGHELARLGREDAEGAGRVRLPLDRVFDQGGRGHRQRLLRPHRRPATAPSS